MLTDTTDFERSLTDYALEDKKKITIRVPSDIYTALKRLSKKTGRTMSMTLTILSMRAIEELQELEKQQSLETSNSPDQNTQKIHSHTPGKNRRRRR